MAIIIKRRSDGTEYQKYQHQEKELVEGQIGECVVVKSLNDKYSDTYVKRTLLKSDQVRGIDAYVYDPSVQDDPVSTMEIKTDFHSKYNSLFVEDHSDFDSGDTEIGYLNKSEAQWLAYYFPNRPDLEIYFIRLEDLREIVKEGIRLYKYKMRSVRKADKTETVYYYPVPIEDIIDYTFTIPATIDYKTMEKIYNDENKISGNRDR